MKLSYDIKFQILLGFLLRLSGVIIGNIYDKNSVLKFKDIDYLVVSDASLYVLQGLSPFERIAYRYTPILAYINIFDHLFFYDFGIFLYITFDCAIAYLIYILAIKETNSTKLGILYSGVWILNPLAAFDSTKGSSDSIICFLVILTCYFFKSRSYLLSGLVYGLAIHMRIYPIIFCLTFFISIDKGKFHFFNLGWWKNKIIFTFSTLLMFLLLNILFYKLYGYTYLFESLLYHFSITDVKHNLSVFFYMFYLASNSLYSKFLGLLVFLPQFSIILICSFKLNSDIYFAMLIQVMTFVYYNKVVTAQYFLWMLSILPLGMINMGLTVKNWMVVALLIVVANSSILRVSYMIEFKGENVFFLLFIVALCYFCIFNSIMYYFISYYDHNRHEKYAKLKNE